MLSGREEHQPLMPNVQEHAYHSRKKLLHFGSRSFSLKTATFFFAFITVTGHVGQSLSLALWRESTNTSSTSKVHVDGYFMHSFTSLISVFIFGIWLLLIRIFKPHNIGETERSFPQLQMFLVGFFGALSIVLQTVAEDRTPFDLQGILGSCMIPLTALIRFIIFRKVPSLLRFISALVVFGMFFVNFIPQFDSNLFDSGQGKYGKYLWPLCFLFAFVPAAVMNVLEEKGLKQENQAQRKKQVNLIYFLFWMSLYQFLVIVIFFWADIIPGFGNFSGVSSFWKGWTHGIECFFGADGCSWIRGMVFILMCVISYLASGLLLRHAEGATYLAVVVSLVTPVVTLFWTLFKRSEFDWETKRVSDLTWSSLAAFLGMLVLLFVYNIGPPERTYHDYQTREVYEEYVPDHIPSLTDPIRDLYEAN